MLLRGLLRLHHFRVLGEAQNERDGLDLLRTHAPGLLVVDANLADGSVRSLLEGARRITPKLRTVLVAPSGAAADHGPSGADAVLQRPFRVREFAEAVGADGSLGR